MATIALPKLRDDRPTVEYRVRLDPGLKDELLLYRRLYVQTYGQEIEPKDLLEPIVRRFLATDRSFRKFKKQHPAAQQAFERVHELQQSEQKSDSRKQ
jgi:hypothetical protein